MEPAFVQKFASAWSDPTPEKLVSLLDPEVVLYQPYAPPIRGRDNAFDEFKRLLEWMPGLHGVVHNFLETEDLVFIEWSMRFPIGKQILSLGAVDRFILNDGRVVERRTFFDRMPIILRLLRKPGIAMGYLKFLYGSYSSGS